jgi:hypothetical protein
VRSIEELEVLLSLARSGERYCSAAMAGTDSGVPERIAAAALEALAARNLLDVRIAEAVLYRLDPTSEAARVSVERTIAAVRQDRAAVLKTILSGAAARDFADAFRVTGKRRTDG